MVSILAVPPSVRHKSLREFPTAGVVAAAAVAVMVIVVAIGIGTGAVVVGRRDGSYCPPYSDSWSDTSKIKRPSTV